MADDRASRLQTYLFDAETAVASGDYATAVDKIEAARLIYDTTPDSEKDGLRMSWRSIEALQHRIEKRHWRAQGYGKARRVEVTIGRTDNDNYDDGT